MEDVHNWYASVVRTESANENLNFGTSWGRWHTWLLAKIRVVVNIGDMSDGSLVPKLVCVRDCGFRVRVRVRVRKLLRGTVTNRPPRTHSSVPTRTAYSLVFKGLFVFRNKASKFISEHHIYRFLSRSG